MYKFASYPFPDVYKIIFGLETFLVSAEPLPITQQENKSVIGRFTNSSIPVFKIKFLTKPVSFMILSFSFTKSLTFPCNVYLISLFINQAINMNCLPNTHNYNFDMLL